MARQRIGVHKAAARGFVLLSLLIILTMGSLYFFVDQLTPAVVDSIRQKRTDAALAAARDALIGYALRYRDVQDPGRMYGYLPMPDLGSSRNVNVACNNLEGCSANTPANVALEDGIFLPTLVGRLPWRTLGIEPLRDGHGECLWLIVSSPYLAGNSTRENGSLVFPDHPRMNWDTLGQFDIVTANGTAALQSTLTSAHQRPVAIIFAPGTPLPSRQDGATLIPAQNRLRATNGDDVTECGGNYDARNYLDPHTLDSLGITNHLAGDNNASAIIGTASRNDDPDLPKQVLSFGKLFKSGTNYISGGCKDCSPLANDVGLSVTSEFLFAAIRRNKSYREQIDSTLGAMQSCLAKPGTTITPLPMLRQADGYAQGTIDDTRGKVPDNAQCTDYPGPTGFFDHYREQVLLAVAPDVALCTSNPDIAGNCLDLTIAGEPPKKCRAVLIFAGQRGSGQTRASDAERKTPRNYLEGNNLTSFITAGQKTYSGSRSFLVVSNGFAAHNDIVRCIPEEGVSTGGAPYSSLTNAALVPYGGPLTNYDATTGTLSLGLTRTSATFPVAVRTDLYGCAWQPQTYAFGSGLRSYFKFRINDALDPLVTTPLDGFTFAIVDGDYNGISACGAAQQHLGYSGDNLDNATIPAIKPPKIGIEVDLRRNFSGSGFNPSGTNTLTNGRKDPSYTGGHVGIVYWGGEANIATTILPASCTAPRVLVGGVCYLPPGEDDNVHGYPASVAGCRPAPANPTAPASPTLASGTYKLDPNLSSVPTNTDFHVRVEITRRTAVPSTAPVLASVRVAATGNISLATPGSSIDGIALSTGDRLLLHKQALPSENGVYSWLGAAVSLARTADFDSATELSGAIVTVAEGTENSFTTWRQSVINPTPGSSDQYWAELGVRVATQSNIDLSAPGSVLDTVTLVSKDRILVKAQTDSSENGVYHWNGASAAMTRTTDANTAARLTGMIVETSEGTDARSWWRFDGSSWSRLNVRVATQSNIDLSSPDATIDDCTVMVAGDRVLVRAQTIASQNGIYVWNGAGIPMTRTTDADTAAELAGLLTQVSEGTDVGRAFHQTTLGAGDTIDVQTITWLPIDKAAAPLFTVQAWILPESPSDAPRIAAMKDTSRAMSTQDSTFTPHLSDTPAIYQAFRRARLGFTIGQSGSRNDQTISINNLFTTWLQ